MKTISLSLFTLIVIAAFLPEWSLAEIETSVEEVDAVNESDVPSVEEVEGVENEVPPVEEVEAVENEVPQSEPRRSGIDMAIVEKACTELEPINVDDVLLKVKEKATGPDMYEAAYEALLLEVDSKFFELQKITSYLAMSLLKNRKARKYVHRYLRRTMKGDLEAFFRETGVDPTLVVGATSVGKKIVEAAFRKGLRTPPGRPDKNVYFKIASHLRDGKAKKAKTAAAVATATAVASLLALLLRKGGKHQKKGESPAEKTKKRL